MKLQAPNGYSIQVQFLTNSGSLIGWKEFKLLPDTSSCACNAYMTFQMRQQNELASKIDFKFETVSWKKGVILTEMGPERSKEAMAFSKAGNFVNSLRAIFRAGDKRASYTHKAPCKPHSLIRTFRWHIKLRWTSLLASKTPWLVVWKLGMSKLPSYTQFWPVNGKIGTVR